MFKRLLPQETSFFEFFEQTTKLAIDACIEIDAIAANPEDMTVRACRIEQIEHDADEVTHRCIDALHATFITPIDRAHIHKLIKRIDDIIDTVDSTSGRIKLYQLKDFYPEVRQLTQVLLAQVRQIDVAVRYLPHLSKKGAEINACCLAVYQHEREADEVLRVALADLFANTKDPIHIIKWKEVFERLERATDRCQEVANIISGIVIEAS